MKYRVLVKPGSKKNEVVESTAGELTVRTTARAHDGEANKAVVAMLAKYFRVGKTRVKIVAGEKGKNKLIEVIEGEWFY